MSLLNYRELGSGPALICLHGLYGYGRNWLSLARHLQANYRVILPDLRNHGASFHDAQWTYELMVQDIHRLSNALALDSFSLLGHSMGGKLAMAFALDSLERLTPRLDHLIVADIAPKAYDSSYHRNILNILAEVPLKELKRRQDAESYLEGQIPEKAVRQFLVSNLKRDAQGEWMWQFNLSVLQQMIDQISGQPELKGVFDSCPVLFLAGARSDYLLPQDQPTIKQFFPEAQFKVIPNAGHWLHIEQAELFLSEIKSFLKS